MGSKRYLFTPGPTTVPPEVLAALAQPVVHHRGSDFRPVYAECLQRLKQVFRTSSEVLLFTASGTGAMESAVANLTASRVSQDRVRKVRFFGSDSYISVDTKEQEVKGYKLAGRSIQPLEINVEKKEPLRAELEAFLGCVRDRSRPIVAGEDGLAAVDLAIRVAAAIDESMRKFKR